MFELLYELVCHGEASHYGWFLEILRLLAVQTVQCAVELMDSSSDCLLVLLIYLGINKDFSGFQRLRCAKLCAIN